MLRYADDIVMIAESEEELEKAINGMKKALKKYNLKINKTKAKVIIYGKQYNNGAQ